MADNKPELEDEPPFRPLEPEEDDDDLHLRPETMAALQEFMQEQMARLEMEAAAESGDAEAKAKFFEQEMSKTFPEDWQMSQFWYDDVTSEKLASEVLRLGGKIACVSCPSVFRACRGAENVTLFEYDRRFEAFGDLFHFYDYNEPAKVPEECKGYFDVVIADPPFLALECLQKLSETVKLIKKPDAKVILCTGDVMTEHAKSLLDLDKTKFTPHHSNNLGNEFACYANYDFSIDSVDKR